MINLIKEWNEKLKFEKMQTSSIPLREFLDNCMVCDDSMTTYYFKTYLYDLGVPYRNDENMLKIINIVE